MAEFRTSRAFDVVFVLVLLVGLTTAYFNRTAVQDWAFFLSHHPSVRAQQVAAAAGLNAEGARLLYRGDPQFVSQATIDSVCDKERLGCTTETGQIYVLDDPAKPDQTVVTAAHEMLHLAYRRLSPNKQDGLSTSLADGITDNTADIHSELASSTTDAERLDEAHSLLGTEYTKIADTLETYYRTYFSDRTKVLDVYAASQR